METQLLSIPTTPEADRESTFFFGGMYPRIPITLNVPEGRRARTVVIMIHPAGNLMLHPNHAAFTERGVASIGMLPRFGTNETRLIVEELMLDLAGVVRFARTQGFENVVLLGASGGGSLISMYQSQAEKPSITSTPAGDPPDLTAENLPPVDGLVVLAAHPSRARILTDSLDPSVVDEHDPHATDAALDMFDPGNGPPYADDFIAAYRTAQEERNHRITRWARAQLAELDSLDNGSRDLQFTVYRTNADLCFADPSIDPSERVSGVNHRGDLREVNRNATYGMATCATYRSWLSQWSLAESNADGYLHIARTSTPALIVELGADEAVFPRHIRGYYDAIPHDAKELVTIAGAKHFTHQQPDRQRELIERVTEWLTRDGS